MTSKSNTATTKSMSQHLSINGKRIMHYFALCCIRIVVSGIISTNDAIEFHCLIEILHKLYIDKLVQAKHHHSE